MDGSEKPTLRGSAVSAIAATERSMTTTTKMLRIFFT